MLNNLRFPQVLLLGNGLNKSGGATGWTKLLQQIQSNKSLALDESVMEKVPYPLLAVLATGITSIRQSKILPICFTAAIKTLWSKSGSPCKPS